MESGDTDDIPFTDEALRSLVVTKTRAFVRLPLIATVSPNRSVYMRVKFIVNGKQIYKQLPQLSDTFTLADALQAAEEFRATLPPSRMKTLPRLVYVVRDVRSNFFKIGITDEKNLTDRLGTLATGNPYPLELVATIPGNWHVEQALHKRFHDAHFRNEWFRPTPELRAWIKEISA